MVGFGSVDRVVEAIREGQLAQAEAITSLAETVTALTQAVQALVALQYIPSPTTPHVSSPSPQETWVAGEIARLKRLGQPIDALTTARIHERATFLDEF